MTKLHTDNNELNTLLDHIRDCQYGPSKINLIAIGKTYLAICKYFAPVSLLIGQSPKTSYWYSPHDRRAHWIDK